MLKVVLIARLILTAKLKVLKNLKMSKSNKHAGQSKTLGGKNSGFLILVCSLSKQEESQKVLVLPYTSNNTVVFTLREIMQLKYTILVKQLNKCYTLSPERFFSWGQMFVTKLCGITVV